MSLSTIQTKPNEPAVPLTGSREDRPPDGPPPGEVLVRVEGVSKKFCRNLKKSLAYGLRDVLAELNPLGGRRRAGAGGAGPTPELRPGEFWANKGISFELRRGECLGIIGHNGAGKTTLLKMLNGLIKPDEGRIEMRGRVGALIALGAGFNPILTGRENIYVNGSILGLKKAEIDAKIEEIIEFSGIREFIDSPVQSYSSGMQVRLGFSVAVNLLRPDVLILDEVLAVGDMAFRIKCLNKVAEISANCATIFISHEALQISRICHRVIWLKKGQLIKDTREVDATLSEYSASIQTIGGPQGGDGAIGRVSGLRINGRPIEVGSHDLVNLDAQEPLEIALLLDPIDSDKSPFIRFAFLEQSGNGVAEVRSAEVSKPTRVPLLCHSGPFEVRLTLPRLQLADGIYMIRFSVSEKNSISWVVFIPRLINIRVTGNGNAWNKALFPGEWQFQSVDYRAEYQVR